jgi:hypothetical protein
MPRRASSEGTRNAGGAAFRSGRSLPMFLLGVSLSPFNTGVKPEPKQNMNDAEVPRSKSTFAQIAPRDR